MHLIAGGFNGTGATFQRAGNGGQGGATDDVPSGSYCGNPSLLVFL